MRLLAIVGSILVLLVSLLYDQIARRIPSRLYTDQAPRSEFDLVPVDGFGKEVHADGFE
jgi:hypothetical protein